MRDVGAAVDALGLVAWNADAEHAKPGLCAIDLICGSREVHVTAQGRGAPVLEGKTVTDHAGYWVEF